TLNVPAQFLNQSTVYLRFKFAGGWGYYWHIDNVSVTGSQSGTLEWTPTTGLYTNAAATTPYGGKALATVYAKPSGTTTYTVTSTSAGGCTSSATTTVTVNPLPTASVESVTNPTTCGGSNGSIALSGLVSGTS